MLRTDVGLIQYIYTSVLGVQITPQQAYDASMLSAGLCQKFGITGRVFANAQQALAITEGPEEVTSRYFESVSRDSMAATVVLHVKREILAREFLDFSILLNVNCPFAASGSVRPLTPESLQSAWPENLSAKVRILADAYMDPDMLVA